MLDVELVAYETADFGVTAVIPGFGFLADLFPDPYLVKWEIAGGKARSPELPGVAVPGDPFAGVIGVAPSHELMEEIAQPRAGARRARRAGRRPPAGDGDPCRRESRPAHDPAARRSAATSTSASSSRARASRLPVHVPGALVSVGDLHFAQGDGEVCGTGIEVAGAVTLRFGVRTPEPPRRAAVVRDAGPARAARRSRRPASRSTRRWTSTRPRAPRCSR